MSAHQHQDSPWGRGYSLCILIPTDEPLTFEQLAELPDRSEIIVLWSGGNGPHVYTLVRAVDGLNDLMLAAVEQELKSERWDWTRTLDDIGSEKWATKVWAGSRQQTQSKEQQ